MFSPPTPTLHRRREDDLDLPLLVWVLPEPMCVIASSVLGGGSVRGRGSSTPRSGPATTGSTRPSTCRAGRVARARRRRRRGGAAHRRRRGRLAIERGRWRAGRCHRRRAGADVGGGAAPAPSTAISPGERCRGPSTSSPSSPPPDRRRPRQPGGHRHRGQDPGPARRRASRARAPPPTPCARGLPRRRRPTTRSRSAGPRSPGGSALARAVHAAVLAGTRRQPRRIDAPVERPRRPSADAPASVITLVPRRRPVGQVGAGRAPRPGPPRPAASTWPPAGPTRRRHGRADRPPTGPTATPASTTVEAGPDLAAALRDAPARPTLVDALGTWVAAHHDFAGPGFSRQVDDLVDVLRGWADAAHRPGRRVRRGRAGGAPRVRGRAAGSATCSAGSTSGWPRVADDVVLVVAGRVLRLETVETLGSVVRRAHRLPHPVRRRGARPTRRP